MSRSLRAHEIRSLFLNYFIHEHNHIFVPSSSVVPHEDDKSLFFTNAGMNQFKPILQGNLSSSVNSAQHWRRVVNTQKCIRAGGKHNDFDEVGMDGHHHTFFEMLGNWSFGDYFKTEACNWAWHFLTARLAIPADRLYVTYFGGDASMGLEPDSECRRIWRAIGVPVERILPFGMRDNFWEMGERGPCGPCTEIHYDRVGGRNAASLVNAPASDGSVVEVWNLVFMQYNRLSDGLHSLPRRHIDCGMGFERLVAIVQGKESNYDTDLFCPIFSAIRFLTRIREYTGRVGSADVDGVDTAYRIVADHIRTLTIALSDGVRPANVDRGYLLRKILRRAVRVAADKLSAKPGQLSALVPTVVDSLGDTFPELRSDPSSVIRIIDAEERRFYEVLRHGRAIFEKSTRDLPTDCIPGDLAWKFYDTYGLPIDVTLIVAEERGLRVDITRFDALRRRASKISQDAYYRAKRPAASH